MLRGHHGRRSTGAQGVSPFDFDEKLMFFRANDLVGFNLNDPVTTLPDQFPNGWDATQAGGTFRPLYKPAAIGGKASLLFDGVNDWLSLGANYPFADNTKTGITIFAVVSSTELAASVDFVCDFGSIGATGYGVIYDNAQIYMYGPSAHGGDSAVTGPTGTVSGSYHLVTSIWEFGVSQRIYLDNVLIASDPTLGLAQLTATEISENPTRAVGSGPFTIGAQSKTAGDADRFLRGNLAELGCYGQAFSDADRTLYQEYVTEFYGI